MSRTERSEDRKDALVGWPSSSDSPSAYIAPKIIPLGKAKHLLRGSAEEGYSDNLHEFYSTGE